MSLSWRPRQLQRVRTAASSRPVPAASSCRRSSTSATSASPSRCCSWCSRPCSSWPSRSPPRARRQMVPGRLQFAGETVYGFVRNTLARDNIGSEHFMKFVPYLFSLFMFILVNNYYGIIPFLQFPTLLADRLRRTAGAHVLVHLRRRRHVEARRARLPQARHDALGRLRADPDPAGAARVLLQHPGPTGHAHPASVRQHVRRPPAADPVRHRRCRTAHQRQPRSTAEWASCPSPSASGSASWRCW